MSNKTAKPTEQPNFNDWIKYIYEECRRMQIENKMQQIKDIKQSFVNTNVNTKQNKS
jgi:hypothetical protein